MSMVVAALLLTLPVGLAQSTERGDAACLQQHSVWLSELRPSESGVELELTALAGMNLASWSVVGYDSRSGSCGSCLQMKVFLFTRTTVVPNEEASGLGTLHLVGATFMDEGGGPIDSIALLDGVFGSVVELISWDGSSFTAVDGPAAGNSSCSVATATAAQALQQNTHEQMPSLQRYDTDSWVMAEPATFGHLNAHMSQPAVGRVIDLTSREVWINEIEYSTGAAGDDLRVEIAGEAGISLTGWWLEYYNGAGSGGGGNCGADHPLGEGGGGGGGGGVSGNGCPSFDRRTIISATTTIPNERSGFGAVMVSAVGLAHGPISGVALVQPLEAAPVGTSPVQVADFVAFNGARFRATDGSAAVAVSTSTGIPIDQCGTSVQLLGGPGWCTWVAGTAASFGRLNAGQFLVQSHSSSVLRLATVVTPGWSGIMDELINRFEQQHQIRVDMFSSFDVYEQMEHGDADMVISHYKKDDGRASTKRFVMTGLGHWPKMLFSNTAVIVGPSHDPAGIRGERDAAQAVAKIAAAGEHLSFAEVPENEFTFELLWRAAGGDSIGRDWMSVVDTPDDAGDGSKVMDAFHLGHYYVWGLIPFLKWKERNNEIAMEAMVWDEQLFRHVMCSVVVRQEAFPRANVRAALMFEQHLLSAESQAYMHSFRDHGHDGPLWFPRAVDNIGHAIYPPYPGEDPIAENFTSSFLCPEDATNAEIIAAESAARTTGAAMPLPLLRTVTSVPGRGLDVTLSVDVARFAGSPLHMTTRAYNGTFPGPVLRVRRGDNIRIRLVNNLATSPGDDQAYPDTHPNPNATNLHLHGMHVPATAYDQALHTCGDDVSTCVVLPQHSITYQYKVDEDHPTGTFWYHPHHHGATALQVGGLMAGLLIVEDEPQETPHELAAMVEVMMVLQMQYWDSLGVATHDTISAQLHDALDMDTSGPRANYILANGQHKPVVSLVANQYARFRVLNANEVATLELEIPHGSHCSMDVLAVDGVFLNRPSHATHGLVLVPGCRMDVAVRCRRAGEYVLRSNPDPARDATMGRHARIAQDIVMLAVAEPQPGTAELPLPTHLPRLPTYMQDDMQFSTPDETSTVTLGDVQNSDYYQINGEIYDGSIQRTVRLGSLQEWRISTDANGRNMHPFHAHLNHFWVVSVDGPTENAALVGVGQWRDTIPIPAAGITVTVRFRAHRYCGVMPYHCHILHHSDMGMAARLAVVGAASECRAVEALHVGRGGAHPSQYCGRGTRWEDQAQLCVSDFNATDAQDFVAALLVVVVAVALACVVLFGKPGSLSLQRGRFICCRPRSTAFKTADSAGQASSLDIALSSNLSDGGGECDDTL